MKASSWPSLSHVYISRPINMARSMVDSLTKPVSALSWRIQAADPISKVHGWKIFRHERVIYTKEGDIEAHTWNINVTMSSRWHCLHHFQWSWTGLSSREYKFLLAVQERSRTMGCNISLSTLHHTCWQLSSWLTVLFCPLCILPI